MLVEEQVVLMVLVQVVLVVVEIRLFKELMAWVVEEVLVHEAEMEL
jgi:hypothetical protein